MNTRGAEMEMRLLRQRRRRHARRAVARIGPIAAAMLLASMSQAPAADAAAPDQPPGLAVTATKSKNACFADMLVVMGNVVPRNEVLVRPDREGFQLSEIKTEIGDTVSSGQILARLTPQNDAQGSAITVNAPVAGLVLAAPTVVGQIASARGDPMFRVVENGDLDVSADVPAKQAYRLAAGQTAKVKVAGVDESDGRVRFVSTMVDPNTQLGQVRISLAHNPQLRVGAFARATVNIGKSCGVSIPLSALLFGPEGAVVQTINNDRIETRRVKIGLFAQDNVEISEGLAEGETIVVRAGAFLREGDRVRPVVSGE
jgi:HlyD family secretion protein